MTRNTRQDLIFIGVALIAMLLMLYIGLFVHDIRTADANFSVEVSA